MIFDSIEDAWKFWVDYGWKVGFGVKKQYYHKNKNGIINVLKIRLNWLVQPVRPGSGYESDWFNFSKPLVNQNQSKTEKTGLNRKKPFKSKNQSWFCKTIRFKQIYQIDHFLNFLINFNMSISKLNIHSQWQKNFHIFLQSYKPLSFVTSL